MRMLSVTEVYWKTCDIPVKKKKKTRYQKAGFHKGREFLLVNNNLSDFRGYQ